MKKMQIVLSLLCLMAPVPAQLLGGNNLAVVRVGKTEFSQGKVDSLAKLLAAQQAKGQQVSPEAMTQLRWAVVDNLVGQELLRLEAESLKLKADSKKVDSLVTLFKAQFPSEEQFKKELKKNGATEDDFREKVRRQLEADMLLEKNVPYPKDPTEKERRDYFEKHKGEAQVNDTIAGVQIYLRVEKGDTPQEIQDKRRILEGLAAQARSKKAPDLMTAVQFFQVLAAQHSDDPLARETGGMMKPFVAKDLGPEFVKIVKNLKVGEISEVFQGKNGLTIFMLTEKNDGKYESYAHKVDYILKLERERDRQMAIKAYLDQLAKKYPVTYLNKDYTPPSPIGGKQ